jgi:hypothetical protein
MTPDSPISTLETPWLRLPATMGKGGATESPKSFVRFECFRDIPASERTLGRAAQILGTTEKSLQKLSAKYFWAERAAAWDSSQAEARAGAIAQELQRQAKEDVELWSKRKRETRERKFKSGDALVDKSEVVLKLPNTERVMKRQDGTTVVLQPRRTRDAIEMLRVGYQLMDEAIEDGLATSAEIEEINDYQIDEYLTAQSDSQTPGSPSGSPEPAAVPPLERSEERLFGPGGVGEDGGAMLSSVAVGGAQSKLRGTDRRPHVPHAPRRHSHDNAADPEGEAH